MEKLKEKFYERFHDGQVVKHFKRELVGDRYYKNDYLYEIIGIAEDANTGSLSVVYKALYDKGDGKRLWTRPLESFCSKVDHDKYKNIKQEYRFEPVES